MPGFPTPRDLWELYPAPPPDAVVRAHESLPDGLNPQLRRMFEVCNGFLTNPGISVFEAECIVERNETYEVAEYAPGFVFFGDDSGGRGFLLHVATPDSPVYVSDLGDLDPDGFEVVGENLEAWIAGLD